MRRFGAPDWQKQDMVTKYEEGKGNEWEWGRLFCGCLYKK